MIFHGCGAILMMGCPIGVDFTVRHADERVSIGDVVRYDTTKEANAILFIDIQGFSGITEDYDQRLVNDMVECHFSKYLECVKRHGGEVNEVAGDGLMVIFKEGELGSHAREAVAAALEIVEENEERDLSDLADQLRCRALTLFDVWDPQETVDPHHQETLTFHPHFHRHGVTSIRSSAQ